MDKKWALIKNGYIDNKVIGDDAFASGIQSQWDYVIDLTNFTPEPDIDASYDPSTNTFGHTQDEIIDAYIDPSDPLLITGLNATFTKFTLNNSGYTCSMTDDQHWVDIGCMRLRAIWCRYAFTQLLVLAQPSCGVLSMENGNIVYQDTKISSGDGTQVLTALETIKFTTPY